METTLAFRALTDADLPLLVEWFNRPHVYEWWGVDATSDGLGGPGDKAARLDQVERKYGSRREGDDRAVERFVILLRDQPVGMIQWSPVDIDAAYAEATGESGSVAIDYLIGDVELTGRGLGPVAIRRFVDEVVRPSSGVRRVMASPSVHNARSIRALEKAGFAWTRDAEVGEPTPERVMVIDDDS